VAEPQHMGISPHYPGLEFLTWTDDAPCTLGGMNYGRGTVWMRFPKVRRRKSKGWRKRVRHTKAVRRRHAV
jgi:hypothetical protein